MVDITFKLEFNRCISICHRVHDIDDIDDIDSMGCLVHQGFGYRNFRGRMVVVNFRLYLPYLDESFV